jgi:signal transduction histidine kinase
MAKETSPESKNLGISRWMRLAKVLWYPTAAVSLGIFLAALPGYFNGFSSGSLEEHLFFSRTNWNPVLVLAFTAASVSAALLSIGLAGVLHRKKPDERMAVFLSYFLLYYGAIFAGPIWMLAGQLSELHLKTISVLSSLFFPLIISLVLIFPDGRFVPSWTRWLVLLSLPSIILDYAFYPTTPAFPTGLLPWLGMIIYVPITLIAFGSQIYRYRVVSDPIKKQQTKWVVYGLLLMFLCFVITTPPYIKMLQRPPGAPLLWWGAVTSLIYSFSLTLLPISLTIAVLRYRLYDIDILINRTLVYGTLTITTIGVYIFIVGYLGNLFQASNQTFLAFLATGFVALLFQPLRERLQAGVNRLMFGERDDPLAVLGSLSKRLEATAEPEAILPGIVDTVGHTLKLPYVAIEVSNGAGAMVVAEYGKPQESIESLSLMHQSKTIGRLLFVRRSPNESFSESEHELLGNIAHQTGAAVHAAKLTSALRRSRQKLVTAREEERRRLRSELHDGLGPTLAGATLRIDSARNKLESNPDLADSLLVETKGQIQETIEDIRGLVYELRPPTLDEMGLVKAVRAYVDQQKSTGVKIMVADSNELPMLPAAVEVAAYRIAVEGITNVIHHAQATEAVISFYQVDNNLIAEILDNGIGLPDPVPVGFGITSMRERAEELDGQLKLIPQFPGTLLRACLPCPEE